MTRFFASVFAFVCMLGLMAWGVKAGVEVALRAVWPPPAPARPAPPAAEPPAPGPGQQAAPPLKGALDRGLEQLRLAAKAALYDPAVADDERRRARRPRPRRRPDLAAVNGPTLAFTLVAKRVYPAPGDPDVPPHRQPPPLEDFKRFRLAISDAPRDSTEVAFIMRLHNAAPRPLKAVMGKLALRDATGKALFVTAFHWPMRPVGRTLPPDWPIHETFAELRRRDRNPHFQQILATPMSELTIDWQPTFVCDADGTMEGDVRAVLYVDREGLPMNQVVNGLAGIVALQYPDGPPPVRWR